MNKAYFYNPEIKKQWMESKLKVFLTFLFVRDSNGRDLRIA